MKQALVIRPHSFVDVITNSSTELFVCNTDKTIEVIRDVLAGVCLAAEYGDVDDILEVRKATKVDIEGGEDNYYYSYPADYGVKMKEGDIIIIGTRENSIPYGLFNLVEDIFNAQRYHLG